MKLLRLTTILIGITLSIELVGQKNIDASTIDQMSNPASVFTEIPLPAPEYKGSYLLNEESEIANIHFSTGEILRNTEYKYDLLNQLIEVNNSSKWRNFDVKYVHKIEVQHGNRLKLVNPSLLGIENMVGLLSVIQENNEAVLAYENSIEIKEATYNVALSIGSRDHQFVKTQNLIYIKNGEILASKIRRNEKSISKKIGANRKEVKIVVNTQNLDLKVDQDLFQLLNHLSI